jgi:hypothetical protein
MSGQEKKQDPRKKIKIVNCTIGYAGKNTRGDDYTIYEITAENGNGETIKEPLRSFSPLPIGQVVEVTVKPFPSEKYGMSYTLTPQRGAGGPHALALNEMKEQLEKLTRRVEGLESAQAARARTDQRQSA